MGTISKDTFKRLFLLYTIGRFKDGCYGLLRLNKVVYFASKQLSSLSPFQYKNYYHGQHSKDLDNINEQLLFMNYTKAIPLDSEQGNKYALTDKKNMDYYNIVISKIDPKMKKAINDAVNEYGYLSETELKKKAYCDEDFLKSDQNDVLMKEKLDKRIKVGLSDDDCEDLELSLDPAFINAMRHL